ncbi:MAG: hypothetical protein IH600_18285 [Bacteroidetes bacterium]|nr:hypothetical protein [Bacteroidota bacterium]
MLRFIYAALCLVSFTLIASSQPYDRIITGDYVRQHFKLQKGEVIKFEEFKKKTYPTATVVWGVPDKQDEARIKAGVAPSGSKLMVVFTDIRTEKEYDRVPSTYKDGVEVSGIGRKAVWSEKWKQLSVLLTPKLIVHIHLDHQGTTDLKEALIAVAKDIQKSVR